MARKSAKPAATDPAAPKTPKARKKAAPLAAPAGADPAPFEPGSAHGEAPFAVAATPARKAAARPKKSAAAASAAEVEVYAPAPAGGFGRSLVIVESPKKAKSISKFLGSKFVVKASMGHVRDLPEKGKDMGIDVAKGYRATYVVPDKKKTTINELRKEAAKVDMVYLATDPDREGEAIAWHLQKALMLPDERIRRVMFFEITEKAVKEAFNHVGPIDMDRVNAQQARRFLDRFVGWQVSPLLWKKVARGLSAGRVQSVATRLIAEREKEIRAFVPEEYWRITADLAPEASTEEADRFQAELAEWKGAKFAAKTEEDRADHPRRPGLGPLRGGGGRAGREA